MEQLYAANEKPDTSPLEEEHEVPIDALGPPFIYSEIKKAMSTLKKRQVCSRSGLNTMRTDYNSGCKLEK